MQKKSNLWMVCSFKTMTLFFIIFSIFLQLIYALSDHEVYPPFDASSNDNHLYFGLMMSFGGFQDSSGVVPAVQVALDLINNSSKSGLLSGHILHYVLYDSQCNRQTALEKFFSLVFSSNPVLALLGSGCSPATEATAEITHFYNLTQVSCASYGDELSDTQQFKLYYQMLPSERSVVFGFSAIIQKYRWRKLSLLVQNEHSFIKISLNLKSLLLQASNNETEVDVTLLQQQEISKSFTEDIVKPGFRILILLMDPQFARNILCQAHHQKKSYPKYLILMSDMYQYNWWTQNGTGKQSHNCSTNDIASVLYQNLVVSPFQNIIHSVDEEDILTDIAMTRQEYLKAYRTKLKESTRYSHNDLAEYCFDATWSIALAMNRSFKVHTGDLSEREIDIPLDINSTMFKGLTGSVQFNDNGIRIAQNFKVFQYRRSEYSEMSLLQEVFVATIKCSNSTLNCTFSYVNGIDDSNLWTYGTPYDGIPIVEVITTHMGVTVFYGFICFLGIAFAVVCVIFNITFRNRKLIRLTSPNLNYIICFGSIIVYSGTVILFVEPTRHPFTAYILCTVRGAMHIVGYNLTFITILAKLGRIYFIFRSARKKITIKDTHLLIFIAALMSVPVGLSIALLIFRSTENYSINLLSSIERPQSQDGVFDVETHYVYYECTPSTYDLVFISLIYANLFILKICALWISFQIRKVKMRGLNESKYVVTIVYISSIMVVVNLILSVTIYSHFTIFKILFGTFDTINITTIVTVTFIPKMVSLYRDPDGEGILGPLTANNANTVVNITLNGPEEVEELKRRIAVMEKTMKTLKEERGVDNES